MKNQIAKVLFGTIILIFSVSLAYFTANYFGDNDIFDYWGTIAAFVGAYALVGVAVSMIFPISLGFLFSADILILHLLYHYYGEWADIVKTGVVGFILLVLYAVSAIFLKDKEGSPRIEVQPQAEAQPKTELRQFAEVHPAPKQPSQELVIYIKTELQAGTHKEEIKKQLLAHGWKEEDIDLAFGALIPQPPR